MLRPRSMLRDQQQFIVEQIKEKDAVLVVSHMGSGKTAATLTAMLDLLNDGTVKRWLVVAPLRVAKDTWADEIAIWDHLHDIDYAVCVGAPEARRYALRKKAKITIVNREVLTWLAKELGSVENWPWDGLIIDESSMFKAAKRRTTKAKRKRADGTVVVSKGGKQTAFGVLATARKKIKRVVLLTGTPGELIDLYGQIYLIDRGERLGATLEDYKARWFDENQYSREIKPRSYAHDEIMGRIGDVMVSLPALQLVEPPAHIPVNVKLSEDVMREYNRFRRTLVSDLHDVEAVNAGVLTNKLLQFCIRKGTPVLTTEGWVPIQQIRADSLVWDGVEWVSCEGVKFNGVRPVVSCFGVEMTEDHRVLTTSGWKTAKEILYGDARSGFDRASVRLPEGHWKVWDEPCGQESHMAGGVRLREADRSPKSIFALSAPTAEEVMRLQAWADGCVREGQPRHDIHSPFSYLGTDEKALSRSEAQGLSKLGWQGYRHARRVVQFIRSLLGGCASWLFGQIEHRQTGQQSLLQQGKLSLGDRRNSGEQSAQYHSYRHPVGTNAVSTGCQKGWFEAHNGEQEVSEGLPKRMVASTRRDEVYDLINCGPRNRFVVLGDSGPLIVHNCGGSMYREDRSIAAVHTAKLDALDELIEQANGEPVLIFYGFKFSLEEIQKRHPDAVVFNQSPTAIKDWNEGRIKKLLMHPKSGGHGTNLQYGGHIAIWFDLTWSLELYLQANARLPRPGQKHIVAIYKILAEGTVDDRVVAALDSKETNQKLIIEAVEAEIVKDFDFEAMFS